MNVFVIGGGGREHALVWALSQSSQVKKIYSATNNAGIGNQTIPAGIDAANIDALAGFAVGQGIDLVVVGPEQPLVDGIVDALQSRGIAAFGPTRAAARLEGSKVFAKEFMMRRCIPTARSIITGTADEAIQAIRSFGFPVVIKAEGLAAGKGVVIAAEEAEAHSAIHDFVIERKLGKAGARLVIEECLAGRELSYLVFCDGDDYASMPVAQDHKRVFDGDRGPNTGGMGAFSAPGLLDASLEKTIRQEIVEPTLEGARAEGFSFRGVLYCGLMLTGDGPRLLEYNVRFGDPETQAIVRRLDSDFAEITMAVARGGLATVQPRWNEESTTCIVLASAGYPGPYETGKVISGLDRAEAMEGVVVFHAGTRLNQNQEVETAGGRVLGVSARGNSLEQATRLAYDAVGKIRFEGMQYRQDIGRTP